MSETPVSTLLLKAAEQNQKIAILLIDGLNTDGAHHKQWCMELALERLVGEETVKRMREAQGWEPGVAP